MIKERPPAEKDQIIAVLKKQLAQEQQAHQHDLKHNKVLIELIIEKGLASNEEAIEQLINLRCATPSNRDIQENHQIEKDSHQKPSRTASKLPGILPHGEGSDTPVPANDREAPARLSRCVEPGQGSPGLTLPEALTRITELEKALQKHDAYENMVNQIASNKNMSYADRVLWIIVLNNHTKEMIANKPFQPNVSKLQQQSGVSPDTATKFFASMHEAKGIKYSNKPQQDDASAFTSVSTIVPLENHTQANTKAATLRIKQREEVKKRRIAQKLIITPCEHCGSEKQEDAQAVIVPFCTNCNEPATERQLLVPANSVRIIHEEITPPSPGHEFSEVIDHEWKEEEDPPSHEFSEAQNTISTEDTVPGHEFSETSLNLTIENSTAPSDQDPLPSHEFSEAQNNTPLNAPPSHEFSEGMTVDTPRGIGTISLISSIHDEMRCGVILPMLQPDGSHYAVFSLKEIQSVIQSSLLEERS